MIAGEHARLETGACVLPPFFEFGGGHFTVLHAGESTHGNGQALGGHITFINGEVGAQKGP